MGINTEKYIRKPLYVDGVRVTEQNFDEMADWCNGEVQVEGPKRFIRVRVQNPKNPRQTKAFVGDWLLWTERSGYKVYTNAAFRRSFDLVEDGVVTPPTAIEEVADGSTPQGEPHEVVEATPQAIADVVNEQQPIEETGLDEGEAYYPPPIEERPQVAGSEETGNPEDDAWTSPGATENAAAAPTPDATIAPQPEEPRLVTETGEDEKLKHEPQIPEEAGGRAKLDVGGKQILTEDEQKRMTPEAIRELVKSGEVVLEQDLAA